MSDCIIHLLTIAHRDFVGWVEERSDEAHRLLRWASSLRSSTHPTLLYRRPALGSHSLTFRCDGSPCPRGKKHKRRRHVDDDKEKLLAIARGKGVGDYKRHV